VSAQLPPRPDVGACDEPQSDVSPPVGVTQPSAGLWLALGTLVLALVEIALLVTHRLPLGIPGVWVWPERACLLTPGYTAGVGVTVFILAALMVGDAIRYHTQPRGWHVALLVLLTTGAQFTLTTCIALDEPDWPLRIAGSSLSDAANGYYSVAARPGPLKAFLADYDLHLNGPAAFPARVATHPPGPVVLTRLLYRLCLARPALLGKLGGFIFSHTGVGAFELSQAGVGITSADAGLYTGTIAVAVPFLFALIASLCIPATYWLAAQLFDRRTGLLAALLAAGLPSLSLFLPCIDGIAAALGIAALALWVAALRRRSPAFAWLAGLAWALGTLWTYGLTSLIVPLAALVWALWRGADRPARRDGVGIAAAVVAGFVVPYLALVLWAGYHPLAAFHGSIAAQKTIMHDYGRGYSPWVFLNLWDVVLFLGGLALPTVVGLAWTWRNAERGGFARAAAIGVALQLALVLVSGETRGEVGRIWMPQMLALLPFGAVALRGVFGGRMLTAAGVVAVAQAAFILAMYASLRVVGF
jgi:hypothetical protein